jgi:tRNA-dihydrouridine synthase
MGYDVFVVKARTYKKLREEALAVSGSIYSPEVGQFVALDDDIYMQAMLAQIQSKARIDALVKVDLELRDVANNGDVVSWDDARASLEVINTRKVVYAAPDELKGLSFRINAYDAQGRKQFANRLGFTLPYRLRVTEELAEFQVRDDLFGDLNELEQVMQRAMHPQGPALQPPPGSIAKR